MWLFALCFCVLCLAHPEPADLDIMYGGAWKAPYGEALALSAIRTGFRAFDSANCFLQAYNETAFGAAFQTAIAEGVVTRDDLFVQTKFTPDAASQCEAYDGPWTPEKCMWDQTADRWTQVHQSVETSLVHLGVDQLDALVVHWLVDDFDEALQIWKAMEDIQRQGLTRHIGISHAHDADVLRRLLAVAEVAPSFVQNPAFAGQQGGNWDRDIRSICREHNIVYQAYSLNHAGNGWVYHHRTVLAIAEKYTRTPQQVVAAFARQSGLLPLVGVQDRANMAQLIAAARDLRLTPEELDLIENLEVGGERGVDAPAELVELTLHNTLDVAISIAWQHPSHTYEAKHIGHHAAPEVISAGSSSALSVHHLHAFYIWESREGEVAPLFQEPPVWVKRLRVDGYHGPEQLVNIGVEFAITVVNTASIDAEVFYDPSSSDRQHSEVKQGLVPGGGGSLTLNTFPGHTFQIRDLRGRVVKTLLAERRLGDPQAFVLHPGDFLELHDEL